MKNVPISKMLKRARERSGHTQAEVAKAIGISQGYYSRLERGAEISSRLIKRVAKALQIPIRLIETKRISQNCDNVAPILKCIGTDTTRLTCEELKFLCRVQGALELPMTNSLVKQLIRFYRSESG